MTLADALQALAADGADPDAWLAVMGALDHLAGSPAVVPQHREETVADVLEKLLSCVREPGWVDRLKHPKAYVRRMLVNRSRSLYRKAERRREAEARGPAPVAPDAPPPPLPDPERLTELLEAALARRQPRYHGFLLQAWDDLQLVLGGATLGDALASRGVSVDNKTLNAGYKSQERLRKAFLEVIDHRQESGAWTLEDADVYREEVRLLLRCQGRARSGVSGGTKLR